MIKIGQFYFNPALIFVVEPQPYNQYVTEPLATIVSSTGHTIKVQETVKNVVERLMDANKPTDWTGYKETERRILERVLGKTQDETLVDAANRIVDERDELNQVVALQILNRK